MLTTVSGTVSGQLRQVSLYVLFFTDQQVKSIGICKPKSDSQAWTAWPLNLGQTVVLKHHNYSSMVHTISKEQRTHLHYGRSLVSWMLLLVSFFGQEVGTFWQMSTVTRVPLHQFPF